jgi:FecR protein
MNRFRLWPHAALIVLAFAAVAGIAAALWTRYERTAEAKELPNAARVERVNGQVAINQSLDTSRPQWVEAAANTPVTVGDRIYTRDNSGSEIAFTGRNFATIDANTSLDVLDLSSQRTQLALRSGSALFDVGSLGSGDLFEVATPCGAVDLEQPGVYRVGINEKDDAVATAFSGAAQVVGQGGAGRIEKGEDLVIPCQSGSQAVKSRVDPDQAGTVLDNYYRSRYPRKYDGRYRSYYTYLDDPYYYDPSRQYTSYNYVSDYVPGVYDLDDYGDWQNVSNYGYCWHPRVDNGWAPYQSGYWTTDYPYGLTWVSNEPWGYAPYHYGRWTYASNEWFWVPEAPRTYPTYSPALVAFLPLNDASVGWVALGPSDPYVPRYYDSSWQAVYLGRRDVIVDRIVNVNVPGAVIVVPAQQFSQVIDPRVVIRVDPQTIARVRPVLDPLAVDPLRRVAFRTLDARRRVDVPQTIAQRVLNSPVVTGAGAPAPPFRRDLARALHVEQLPDRVRNQKLQIADRGVANQQRAENVSQPNQQANLAAEQARERQMADLSRQAARGDRNARQQMQELRKQQVEQQRSERMNAQQAQGERVRQQMQQQQSQREVLRQQQQAQRESARQQMITSQQQRRAATQQQIQSQREQRGQTEIRRPPAVRSSQQQQPLKPQPPQQRIERRPTPQYRPPAQPRVITTPQPQMRQQPGREQTAPRTAPREVHPQQQAQPRPQAPAPQKQPAQGKPAEQPGNRKKPPEK